MTPTSHICALLSSLITLWTASTICFSYGTILEPLCSRCFGVLWLYDYKVRACRLNSVQSAWNTNNNLKFLFPEGSVGGGSTLTMVIDPTTYYQVYGSWLLICYGSRILIDYGRWLSIGYGSWILIDYGRWISIDYGRWLSDDYGSRILIGYGCFHYAGTVSRIDIKLMLCAFID